MKRILKNAVILLAFGLCLTACGTQSSVRQSPEKDTWAVYWYLCGSDLETDYGCASKDLEEMLAVDLPDNIQVVIQTGGADSWQSGVVDAEKLQRYVYDSEGFRLVNEQPLASMGEAETLTDFLRFCRDAYPAEHTMVLFWNHGGGSVSGAAFDEIYGYDALTLNEFYTAFNDVYELSAESPPLDIVGFDTCLMSTIDTAYTFCDVSQYLVASEETEPGCGWYYTGWLQALADDPDMDGASLGKAICDSYAWGCKLDGVEDEITLSVTDLQRIGPLLEAYESLGQEALLTALHDPLFFPTLGREASRSESYGGNTPDQGYSNMVDLGHLARNCSNLLPQNAQAVLRGLDECVIYQVNGPYRSEATGLSCYYNYNGDIDDFIGYAGVGASEAFKHLYDYELNGSLSEDGMDYISTIGYTEDTLPEVPTLTNSDIEDYSVTVDSDGCAVLNLGPEVANLLKGVYFQLAYLDEDEDLVLLLGRDNDIDMDWENGVFKDNFRGVWGSIDGNLVYMEIVYEGEDYNIYSVPILLNGEECNLRVIYDYNDGCYYILGARQGLDSGTGMADKNLIQLQPGDEIITIHYATSISGDDDFEAYEADSFTVTESTSFEEMGLGDGTFIMLFELVDVRNETAWSKPVSFTVAGGNIYTEA